MAKEEKFARRCDISGKGMNAGFVIEDGDMYIASQEDLLIHLKGVKWVDSEGITDDELMEYYCQEEYYYYTEWEELDEDFYFTADGEEIETL